MSEAISSHLLTNKDNYIVILAYKIFRILITITAAFSYKTKQINTVNAFLNAELDELVYYYFSYGFEQLEKYLRLKKAFYGLKKLY